MLDMMDHEMQICLVELVGTLAFVYFLNNNKTGPAWMGGVALAVIIFVAKMVVPHAKAHLNPAVTIGLASIHNNVLDVLMKPKNIKCILAQVVGGVLAVSMPPTTMFALN